MQLRVIAFVLVLVGVRGLTAPRGNASLASPATESVQAGDASAREVAQLRAKLGGLATSFRQMLKKDGQLAHSKVAPALNLFLENLDSALKDTESEKDPGVAMRKLNAVRSGVGSLMKDLTTRQETLMSENEAQTNSLLLGVLMTKQKAPMAQQLEVLNSKDFRNLSLSKALLANHSSTMPLFAQAAEYLDRHGAHTNASAALELVADRSQNLAASLQKRVDALEREYQVRQQHHNKRMQSLEEAFKANHKDNIAKALLKREERKFQKWAAVRKHDIDTMKAAVEAVKKGDMKALRKAQDALTDSIKAMQTQTGGFLYLIQLAHAALQKDCPYCAAQCVDKCHSDGHSYTQCLSECADAGKGK